MSESPAPLPLPPLALPPLPTLRGERVLLRESRPTDIDDRLVHPIDPDEEDGYGSAWRREWDGRRFHTREHLIASGDGPPDPSVYSWAVEYDGHCVGNTRLTIDADQHCATYSIGLFVADLRGHGLGREITRLVLDWAFERLRIHRVQLEVLGTNRRAIACYLACGFRHEGTRRSAALYPDGWHDFHLMAVLDTDYRADHGASIPGQPKQADDRLAAVLVEPALARFRDVFDLGDEPIHVSFTGWHRYALTSGDRVFTIPRTHLWVAPAEREARVLGALDHPLVPSLLDYRTDERISPYPITVTRRLPGRALEDRQATTTLTDLTALMRQLGSVIATWHEAHVELDLARLPGHDAFGRRCTAATFTRHAVHAAQLLSLPTARVDRWARAVQSLFDLPDVTVHGDIHEGQLLVDDTGTLTGVIDWETAGACHPLKDFDFGEWGFWLFAEFEPAFAQLRQAAWAAYASARGLAIDWLAPHLFFTVVDIATTAPETAWQQCRQDNGLALLRAADAELG